MTLHENTKLFQQAISFTAQEKGILNIYVEKDYWVTLALKLIFSQKTKAFTVFKGGTALSKCFFGIERFSEDIDLVIMTLPNESGNETRSKLKAISYSVQAFIPEVEIKGVTNKKGRIRKTAHEYPKVFKGKFGQVRDKIIIESTSLGDYQPFLTKTVDSYIYQMMVTTNQTELIRAFNLEPIEVRVLDPKRTLCEKIMSLVRFSHTERPLEDLKMKVRHLYDLFHLLNDDELRTFLQSETFALMLTKVAENDLISFNSNNAWIRIHPSEALIFKNPEETWRMLERTYELDFSRLVYGRLPNPKEILSVIETIANRLTEIKWEIN
jgi:predicted nucleotidyltransferase component of viral defense system